MSPQRLDHCDNRTRMFKVVLIGDGGVGKSSLMNRYVSNKFDTQSFHTIGVEFLNKDLEVNGSKVTLQIWDTAGQERFRSLRTPFYRGADCCLLTYAVDDPLSLRNLAQWRQEFVDYADVQDPASFPFVVIGNKVDVEERRVTRDEAEAWCASHGSLPLFEASAKDALNVDAAFYAAVRKIMERETKSERNSASHAAPGTVDLRKRRKPNNQTGCC